MSIKFVKAAAFAMAGTIAMTAGQALAQDEKPRSLDQLLEFVKQGQVTEARQNRAREQAFATDKANQAAELKRAEAERASQEQLSAELEDAFEANELLVAAKQEQLKEKLGTLAELFGHLTSTAGDLASTLEFSLTSAQYPDREVFLEELIAKMSGSDKLPSIEEIERVWYELNREMVETGQVVSFQAQVAKPNGDKLDQKVVRIGAFNVISEDGQYLQYVPSKGSLEELARQPSGPYIGWAKELADSSEGLHRFGIDPTGPSGGSFLAALINSPNLEERWHQGGYIGYAITALGVFGFLLAFIRLGYLATVSAKVSSQLKSDKANVNNPLGRVLKIHEDNPSMDTETLELKLSEGILKETPKLESGLTLLKIISAIAPLMGLLGTVTGMIVTFQAITIFGAGDPKAMAGGISGALVTTVLGLLVAIPTVLLHTIVNGRAQRIIHVLNEQTTGIIAEHTEANLRK
ncbi:MAG: MotA/TolQ/ExbB proton channel family protein [Pseudomonadales bacterium]|nr:MotA/TolQ/ExbB proton channel family protein [Halieaceae bacterium]MCP5165979.1 MotA/TolQ/ExbB proton channel family protein [Pseudomonadales bacterium]MCP5187338.1 MotA/TolQ/ExbB proton channel family protein [Pseudomonadales bacterium]